MRQDEIHERVNRFARWHYEFDLQGIRTPIADPTRINRHQQRKAYFFDPLVKFAGGTLANRRVLDLGCNAGFWSLACIEAGASEVIGIDGRRMHIEQAELVFAVKGIEKSRYNFLTANLFEIDFRELGSFDLVLCLGLLYHVRHPILLLEKIVEVNDDLLVIDTALSRAKGAHLEIAREPTDDPRNSVDSEIVLRPTRQAVIELTSEVGYKTVALEPRMSDYTGAEDYRAGVRRAFWCAKQTSLNELPVSVERLKAASHLTSSPDGRLSTKIKNRLRRLARRAALPTVR